MNAIKRFLSMIAEIVTEARKAKAIKGIGK
jgi:hypothetical protein